VSTASRSSQTVPTTTISAESASASGRGLGTLAIVNAVAGLVGFIALALVFDFPAVLDAPAGEALRLFAANQTVVVASYYLLAATGIGFAVLAVGLHRRLDSPPAGLLAGITVLGVLAGLAQTIGFIRWPFLVPVLSDQWAAGTDRASVATVYEAFNTYAGAAIGEHLGWALQAAWGVGVAVALQRTGTIGNALARTGLVLAAGFGALTVTAFALPGAAGEATEAIQGPVYSLWVVWTAVLGAVLLRRRRIA
jgi:hypothetical protein